MPTMKQVDRGPILLTVAAVLLLFAVGADLIGDAKANAQRQEALLRDQELLRDQNAWTIEIRAELDRQRAMILDSRRRLDHLVNQFRTMHEQFEKWQISRPETARHNQAEGDHWPMASGK
jgi:hypothetical protein